MTVPPAVRALAIIIALLTVPTAASAHTTPATRSAVVQVEDSRAVMLVTWTAPSGMFGRMLMLRAILAGGDGRDALRALLTRRALGGLAVTVDGKPAAVLNSRSKLQLDVTSMATHRVTVLVEFELPGSAHNLMVRATGAERTRLLWHGRTSKRRPPSSAQAERAWVFGPEPLSIVLH